MQPQELRLLEKLAQHVDRRYAIVEIGSHTGLSTVHMAKATTSHVTAIDPFGDPRPDSKDDPFGLGSGAAVMAEFYANLVYHDVSARVTHLRTTALELAPMWTQPIGLLFDDALHEKEAVVAHWRAYSKYVVHDGWLALHDYTSDPTHPYYGVYQAVHDVILPSGEWEPKHVEGHLWVARKV